tara:strand:- start:8111 stop:8845 length:735 start_codon:yes stop_codon:yes gene_type:complete
VAKLVGHRPIFVPRPHGLLDDGANPALTLDVCLRALGLDRDRVAIGIHRLTTTGLLASEANSLERALALAELTSPGDRTLGTLLTTCHIELTDERLTLGGSGNRGEREWLGVVDFPTPQALTDLGEYDGQDVASGTAPDHSVEVIGGASGPRHAGGVGLAELDLSEPTIGQAKVNDGASAFHRAASLSRLIVGRLGADMASHPSLVTKQTHLVTDSGIGAALLAQKGLATNLMLALASHDVSPL